MMGEEKEGNEASKPRIPLSWKKGVASFVVKPLVKTISSLFRSLFCEA